MTLNDINEKIAQVSMHHVLAAPPIESLDINEEKLKTYMPENLQKELKKHDIIKTEVNRAKVILTVNSTKNFESLKIIIYEALKQIHPRIKLHEIKDITIYYSNRKNNITYSVSAIKFNNRKTKEANLTNNQIDKLKKLYPDIMKYFTNKSNLNIYHYKDLSIYIPNNSNTIQYIDHEIIWAMIEANWEIGIDKAINITKQTAKHIETKGFTLDQNTNKYHINHFTVTPYQNDWQNIYGTILEIYDTQKNRTIKLEYDLTTKKLEIFDNNIPLNTTDSQNIILDLYHIIEDSNICGVILYFLQQVLTDKPIIIKDV